MALPETPAFSLVPTARAASYMQREHLEATPDSEALQRLALAAGATAFAEDPTDRVGILCMPTNRRNPLHAYWRSDENSIALCTNPTEFSTDGFTRALWEKLQCDPKHNPDYPQYSQRRQSAGIIGAGIGVGMVSIASVVERQIPQTEAYAESAELLGTWILLMSVLMVSVMALRTKLDQAIYRASHPLPSNQAHPIRIEPKA